MLRIGAVSYLNTRPLIFGLRERLRGVGELSLDLPSRLADHLADGKLDVALVPSIEFFHGIGRGYRVVSDAAIVCRGPVWSVRLLSRVPISQITRVALDEGSRTSVMLLRILLSELHGLYPETVCLPIDQDPDAVDADAVLVIGDRAMHPTVGLYEEIWDLGERWWDWTGLPFVFAMWVARAELDDADALKHILEASRDEGISQIDEIARQVAASHGLAIADLQRYLSTNLHFRLGPRELDGLELYRLKACRLKAAAEHPSKTRSLSGARSR